MRRLPFICLALSLVMSVASATAATPEALITAPPLPGSDFAERLAHHRAEHVRPGFAADGAQDPTWVGGDALAQVALNFENLYEASWEIEHQEITVELDPFIPQLSAEVTATLVANKDGIDQVGFRLGLVDKVSVTDADGTPLKAKLGKLFGTMSQLTVTLAEPMKADDTREVRVKYTRNLNCSQKTSALKFCSFDNDIWSVMFYRYYLSSAEVYHSPFKSTLHVITPNDRRAAAPGTPTGPDQLPNKRLVWHFEQPERTSNAGFAVAKYEVTASNEASSKTPIRLYTLPNFKVTAKPLLGEILTMMKFYEERFSAFPWAGMNFVQLANNFGGGYAPLSGTFMYRNVFGAKVGGQGYNSFSELTAHELGHQWWGNFVRPLSNGDVSLSESLAEYSSCLYTEQVLENRSQLIQDNLSFIYTVGEKDDRPMQAQNVYSSPKYVQIIYHKGAVVLHMLRHELGDEVMHKGLQTYVQTWGRDYAKVSHLQEAMEKASGLDLGWFFEQWWQRKGKIYLELAGRVEPLDDGQYEVRLRIKQLTELAFRFKLPVRITYADGSFDDVDLDVIPDDKEDRVTVVKHVVDKPVRGVRPDRTRKLLRRFIHLTEGDVTLDGLVDGADLIEAAFRVNRAVVWKNNFFPNSLWDEFFDISPNYRIDAEDVDLIVSSAGETSVPF